MSFSALDNYLAENAGRFQAELCELLRIPSVSGDPAHRADCRTAAEAVRDKLAGIGCEVELVETSGHPIVFARTPALPDAPTALVYGHYDVQPARMCDGWSHAPFDPVIRDGRVYARGATDDKGQVLTHVHSVEAWMKTAGRPPVNVLFVIEGEEEVGSKNLDEFLEARAADLRCDVAVVSDTSQYGPNQPAITYGLRGLVGCEITVTGPKNDLHSGVYGGSLANPANVLCALVASLHDATGRVAVAGFYDEVAPMPETERARIAALPFDEEQFLKNVGVKSGRGEAGYSANERRWARPTCDVNGIFGGYTGAGPKTIIPSTATAKITCRLVPDQNPERVLEALHRHLEARLPQGTGLTFTASQGCPGIVADTSSPFMTAAESAIRSAWGVSPVLIREGGSIPVVESLKRILGVETLLLGWGQNTDNLHGPDEHFSLDDYRRGTIASARLWYELSERP